jgi:antitoxin ParD1/3/4
MAITLKPEQEHRIEKALRSGGYQNAEEVIDRALEILDEQNAWLAASRDSVNEKIRRGLDELDRGEGIPEDVLDAHLAKLKSQTE